MAWWVCAHEICIPQVGSPAHIPDKSPAQVNTIIHWLTQLLRRQRLSGQDRASGAGGGGVCRMNLVRQPPPREARSLLHENQCPAMDSCGVMDMFWGLSSGVHVSCVRNSFMSGGRPTVQSCAVPFPPTGCTVPCTVRHCSTSATRTVLSCVVLRTDTAVTALTTPLHLPRVPSALPGTLGDLPCFSA